MTKLHGFILIFIVFQHFQPSQQNCPEEYSYNGLSVKWDQTTNAVNVESDPLCYLNDDLVKRNCTDDEWTPPVEEVGPCLKITKSFNLTSCPPGFHKISKSNNDYCYKTGPPNTWNYPCFSSGGASIITDLNSEETDSLMDQLIAMNTSRYFWLPAQRVKLFNPVVWSIPGQNWGEQVVANKYLWYHNLIWKNCLALDVEQRALVTDSCSQVYPSLCFYINDIHYPAICPRGYHPFRYKPDNGTCYGIVKSETGLTFDEFLKSKCKKPMSDTALNRFIYKKISELTELPNDEWCWFQISVTDKNSENDYNRNRFVFSGLEGTINSMGTLAITNSSSTLSCMACETNAIYGETELMFEYNEVENKLYLTIYFPSGLWKYDNNDKGIQCFSDAKGFFTVININDLPYLSVQLEKDEDHNPIEKLVYMIDLVTQRSAQYWCEGHLLNFSLISTNKIVVNPKGREIHVFSLTVRFYDVLYDKPDTTELDILILNISVALDAEKVLLMDIYDFTPEFITVLLHVHTAVIANYEDDESNIQETYNNLKERTLLYMSTLNAHMLNLTSSLYCLPNTSSDVNLDWELTPIGHMSAPKQFCLQSNGLPVRRQCLGSYHNGGSWGEVEGSCDTSYKPTDTTTFLYSVVKGLLPSNDTSRFLTEGLSYVLSDVGIIIPADIYYLSMSLQHILHIAQENKTCVDLGNIENIAWIMDRVMDLDCDYLRLSQTLNSTNVILNSINDIIEIIARQVLNDTNVETNSSNSVSFDDAYQLAVKPQFIVQISYPMLNNVTGIAISRESHTESFTDMIIKPLYSNTSLDEVLSIKNLESATWLSAKLLNSLKIICNESNDNDNSTHKENMHIIVSIFQNDAVFQELVKNDHTINSRIVGVSIPGYLPNLKYPLPLVFRQLNKHKAQKLCAFWDFETQKSTSVSGFWKTQGCYPVTSKDNITVCECYHLTHFSQLIKPTNENNKYPSDTQHGKVLNIITLVGCFLSLIGIVCIWITAMVFANWRKKAGTKVLLQLSTAIALPLVFMIIFNLDNSIFVTENDLFVVATHMKPLCIVLGSLLHYSILASFMWMLITAILQFIRYVRVLGVSRPSRFLCKFAVIGWGIPIVPVIIVLSLDVENYIPDSSHCKRICYPKGYFFLLSVMLPICIILLVNVVLFILVLHSISRGSNEKMKSTDIDLVGAQLRLSVFLFFLLGLTWVFGIFSFTENVLWSYFFCLTSTLQGFVFFIYFIVCDPNTRNMWITLMKPPFTSSSSRNSITSFSQS